MHILARRLVVVLISCFSFAAVNAQEAVEQRTEETVEPKPIEQTTEASPKPQKETEQKPRRDVQDSMTADEFKAAGLDKLSAEELKSLNAWLQGYRQTAETKAAENATAKANAEIQKKITPDIKAQMAGGILTRVAGEFKGLTGHTVIKLDDGSVWKQANADDRYRAQVTNSPPVKVTHTGFGYKMRIVGTGEFYVDPVRK
jgi:hypothetical protein